MPLEDPLLKSNDIIEPTTSKAILENEIFLAYKKSMESGAETSASPEDIIINLSNDIAFALNKYFITADVLTEVTVANGQMDAVGGVSDKEGTGEGTGTITTQAEVERKEDREKGVITKYLGSGNFEVNFKNTGESQIKDSKIELKVEV